MKNKQCIELTSTSNKIGIWLQFWYSLYSLCSNMASLPGHTGTFLGHRPWKSSLKCNKTSPTGFFSEDVALNDANPLLSMINLRLFLLKYKDNFRPNKKTNTNGLKSRSQTALGICVTREGWVHFTETWMLQILLLLFLFDKRKKMIDKYLAHSSDQTSRMVLIPQTYAVHFNWVFSFILNRSGVAKIKLMCKSYRRTRFLTQRNFLQTSK